jgi:galactose oxidase
MFQFLAAPNPGLRCTMAPFAPGRSSRVLGVLGAAALLVSTACTDDRSDPGPRPPEPDPLDSGAGEDAPINLTYVCGNRFIVSNAHGVPVSVTYQVVGTEEEGTADLPAAPEIDPAVSEVPIETRARGTVQLLLDGKALLAKANEGTPCNPAGGAPPAFASASAESSGEWTAVFPWPNVAVHLALLPDGRVLTLGRTGSPNVWKPASGIFTAVPSPAWLFCSGHALLSDGRVFLAGGHISDTHGLPNTTTFSATAGWARSAPMAQGRWYPTTTVMSDGDVVIIAGKDQAAANVLIPEIWSNGSVRRLTTASQAFPYYPRAVLAPNGKLLIVGPVVWTKYLSTAGTGSWTAGPKHLGGARNYGSAVMYDDGKVMVAGGAYTTNTAEILNLNVAKPAWSWTGSMNFARRHLNLTVLPTGEVLATGGVAGTAFNDLTKGVRAAEIWNPVTGQWTTLASSAVTRGYHASSLLLPDGRVLHAGSGDGAGAPAERNAQIFSPPYLFRGPRPTITRAPTEAHYDTQFRITTDDAAAITRVSLIRLGAPTHSFDQNQRFQWLTFTADATGLTVTAPKSSNRAPPGHYLVFILNDANVPSVGKIVRIF